MDYNRTLLIVDDEPETLKGYREFLAPRPESVSRKSSRLAFGTGPEKSESLEEFKILSAPSGEEALKIFEAEIKAGRRVAAGFFDVKLGSGMDGLALIHALKSLDRDLHCVVVTAYQDRSVEEINQLFGDDFKDQWDYLNKPFTQGEIIQKARQMVAAWNRKQQVEALQQQLIRSERMAAIGQVARGIGHEFGNILLRIMGKADLALMEKAIEPIQEHLKVILKASERAGVVVRNLQSFSKNEPSFQHESLSKPFEDALTLLSHEMVKSSVKLDKQFDPALPKQRIDVGGMSQVALNLMINAIHAMPKGGTLTVCTETGKDASGAPAVIARVKDTGTGIPAEVLPRIFDYAFTTKGDKGSGLGLSISKDIVESNGGEITVQTEPGKGTEFRVVLRVTS